MAEYMTRLHTVEAWKVLDEKDRPDWVVNVVERNRIVEVTTDNDGLTFVAIPGEYIVRYEDGTFGLMPAYKFEEEYARTDSR